MERRRHRRTNIYIFTKKLQKNIPAPGVLTGVPEPCTSVRWVRVWRRLISSVVDQTKEKCERESSSSTLRHMTGHNMVVQCTQNTSHNVPPYASKNCFADLWNPSTSKCDTITRTIAAAFDGNVSNGKASLPWTPSDLYIWVLVVADCSCRFVR